jgi:hypothetical protein
MCRNRIQNRARSTQALRPENPHWEAAAYLALEAMQDQCCPGCRFAQPAVAEPFHFRSGPQRARACS